LDKSLDHIDDLIGKYLAGEAEADEIAFVESWAKESQDNQRHMEQFKTIFHRASEVKEFQAFDTDAAWAKLKGSLRESKTKTVHFEPDRISRKLFWRIAASIVVVLGAGFFAYKLSLSGNSTQPIVVVATTDVVTDTLPDGSNIVLNKETKLTYTFDKKQKTHKVALKGEAYFNIQHDDNKTFIVDIAGVYVRDIGTSFNVKALPESNTVEVVVQEGEVMFYTDNDSGVYLRANGKGIYNKTTKTFTIDQPEANVLAYKTKFFSFTNTDLLTVVEDLNRVYPRKIVLSESVKNCHLTVSFNDESQDEIIAVIAETLGLSVRETGGKILLEGPGCESE
jgi:transmembrane sensor